MLRPLKGGGLVIMGLHYKPEKLVFGGLASKVVPVLGRLGLGFFSPPKRGVRPSLTLSLSGLLRSYWT